MEMSMHILVLWSSRSLSRHMANSKMQALCTCIGKWFYNCAWSQLLQCQSLEIWVRCRCWRPMWDCDASSQCTRTGRFHTASLCIVTWLQGCCWVSHTERRGRESQCEGADTVEALQQRGCSFVVSGSILEWMALIEAQWYVYCGRPSILPIVSMSRSFTDFKSPKYPINCCVQVLNGCVLMSGLHAAC